MSEFRRTVLLIDDSKTFQSLFRAELATADCDVLCCNSGAQALQLIGNQYVDFICSSFYLPDIEGIELCRQIRALTKYAYKPVVLLTSIDADDALMQALPAGVTEIFHKNDVAALLAFIKRFPARNAQLKGRVLYVEDSVAQRQALTALLEHRGLAVDAFSSADAAWPHFQAQAYDVVLTDIVLDGSMSGLAFVNRIRRLPGAQGDTPILALTAFDDRTRRIELFNLGVTDYIIKPIAEEELFARISGLIGIRRLMAEIELDRQRRQLEEQVAARTAELERTNKELQSFSYSVSHDLRTPLRAIAGFCQIIRNQESATLSDDGRKMFERVLHNTQRMSELIDSILDYSRSGRQPLQAQRVDLGKIAHDVVDELAAEHAHAHIEFGPLPTIEGDPVMLMRILQNLIGNALKFSARNPSPVIAIGMAAVNGEQVCYVRDNGSGFDMRYADKLFGLFQRLHKDSDYPGTGVGLAITKRLVERHGGSIWAEAKPDAGATFFFTFGQPASA